jgi:hypothetical protein
VPNRQTGKAASNAPDRPSALILPAAFADINIAKCYPVNGSRVTIIDGGHEWNWRSKISRTKSPPSPSRTAGHRWSGGGRIKVYEPHGPKGKAAPLDMSEVTFLASLGLRMLLTVARALDRRGAKTVLLSPKPVVREVLKLSGFDQLMPVHNDEGTALAFLAGSEGR